MPRRIVILLMLAACVTFSSATSEARGRRNSGSTQASAKARIARQASAIASQVQAAEKTKVVAELERTQQQARAGDATEKLSSAKSKVEDAHAALKSSSAARQELEQQIEAAVGPDHPVVIAHRRYEEARAEFQSLRQRILKSQTYRERTAAWESEGLSTNAVADKQTELLHADPKYLPAEAAYAQSRAEYHQKLHELLANDPRWQEAIADLKASQHDQTDAEHVAHGQAARAINAKSRARDADQAATAAAARVAQGQAALNRLQQQYKGYGGKNLLGAPQPSNPKSKSK